MLPEDFDVTTVELRLALQKVNGMWKVVAGQVGGRVQHKSMQGVPDALRTSVEVEPMRMKTPSAACDDAAMSRYADAMIRRVLDRMNQALRGSDEV